MLSLGHYASKASAVALGCIPFPNQAVLICIACILRENVSPCTFMDVYTHTVACPVTETD